MHEELARKQSAFFEAAFGRDWKEAKEKMFPLLDDTPDTFRIYFHWAYSRRIFCEPMHIFKDETIRAHHNLLIRTYILGDKLQDSDFQDAIMDVFIACCRENSIWPIRHMSFVFKNTLDNSPLCSFLVDSLVFVSYASESTPWHDPIFRSCFNEDALFAMVAKLMENKQTGVAKISGPWVNSRCVYHIHKSDRPCYRKGLGLE